MNNRQLKHIAQQALYSEYGFNPKLSDITLLEAESTGLYILFSVNGHEYRFASRYFPIGHGEEKINTVWTGKGTIEKTNR